MEQTANTHARCRFRAVQGAWPSPAGWRPVSDKAVEADIGNLARVHAPFVPTDAPAAPRDAGHAGISRAFWRCAHPGQPDGKR